MKGVALLVLAGSMSSCALFKKGDTPANVVVSVKEQRMAIYSKDGKVVRHYPVSTSKFGLSDKPGTYGTPLGMHEIVAKIGHGAPPGAVFKSRQPTGEVLKPDSPGRDPIVTRILWLKGLEERNKNAYQRYIYIHGTAEERNIGKPVSYGCIRMKSKDVIDLFNRTGIGSNVLVVQGGLPSTVPPLMPRPTPVLPQEAPPIFLNPNQSPQGPLGRPEPPQVLLAQNTPRQAPLGSSASLGGFSGASVASGLPESAGDMLEGSFQTRRLENGSTVIYTATGPSASAPIVLKSKKTATKKPPAS
jgi:hypothetical protein